MTDWKKWLPLIIVTAMFLLTGVLLFRQITRAAAAEHTLTETTLASLSDAAEEVQALALAMDKLGIAVSPGQTASLLHEALLSADRARHSLSLLPADPEILAPALSYLSRLSRSTGSALTRLGSGLPVSDGEMAELSGTKADLQLLHAELSLAREALLSGVPLAEALPTSAISPAPDAAELAAYRALPSEPIGTGAALHIARDFVGAERVVSVTHAPGVNGADPTFGVTVQTSDLQLNVVVTQRGGKVLLMTPETAGFAMTHTVEECQQAAAAFLESRGFGGMAPTWYEIYDGLCVLTFVHVQDGVLVWPDRILLQVRMDTAEVVGVQARSYWQNHIPRKLHAPILSQQEARASLAPGVTVEGVRLAVIPAGTQERLCWQFTIAADGEGYICFVDAETGSQLLLEKIMQLEYGAVAA